jgi:hypothetical protein
MPRRITLFFLFLVSYVPLFVILAIQLLDPKVTDPGYGRQPVGTILHNNRLPLFFLGLSAAALAYYFMFAAVNNRSGFRNPVRVRKVENTGAEYLSYLATYVVPFAGLKLGTWNEMVATALLFGMIGFIYTRTNLIYANPTLALFGYYLYRVTLDNGDQKTVIAKGKVRENEFYAYKEFNEEIYFIKPPAHD